MNSARRLGQLCFLCLAGLVAAPGCMSGAGDAPSSIPAPVVTITAADLAALAPGASLRVDLRTTTRYRFDARAGALDLRRVEITDRAGDVAPMDRWLARGRNSAPSARVFDLSGQPEASSDLPEGVAVDELRIIRIYLYDSNGNLVGIIYVIER